VRRLICLFLLICVPLHSFAMQGSWLLSGAGSDMAHEIAHDAGVRHHHHNGSTGMHFDDSDESVQHILDHSTSPQTFDPPAPMPAPVFIELISLVPAEPSQFMPEPLPDCPHRPPAFTLG